jgi:hypothetical protein
MVPPKEQHMGSRSHKIKRCNAPRKKPKWRHLYTTNVPSGLDELHRTLVRLIRNYVRSARRYQAIDVGPLEYTLAGVAATVAVTEAGTACPKRVFKFSDDYAHPEFCLRFERYLAECVAYADRG